MLGWLRRKSTVSQTAAKLYGSAVAQARLPVFYSSHSVPDTAEGRLEMIVLHLFVLLERLKREGEAGQLLGRGVLETFLTDMDDSMREIGISDLGVPKRIKKTAAAVQERFDDYRAGLSTRDNAALAASLARHTGIGEADGRGLAAYLRRASAALDGAEQTGLLVGDVRFPLP